jgi:hypothetical protein
MPDPLGNSDFAFTAPPAAALIETTSDRSYRQAMAVVGRSIASRSRNVRGVLGWGGEPTSMESSTILPGVL